MLHAGGTRFIGVYLARQLIEAGHEVTLLTRGKKPVTSQIPDDTDQSYEAYKQAVKHIACDRTDAAALKEKLGGQGFEGELMGAKHFAIEGCVLVTPARKSRNCQAGVQQGAHGQPSISWQVQVCCSSASSPQSCWMRMLQMIQLALAQAGQQDYIQCSRLYQASGWGKQT